MTKRRPSEKITVRLSSAQVHYLTHLLGQQDSINARMIKERLEYCELQQDIKHIQWEQAEKAEWAAENSK